MEDFNLVLYEWPLYSEFRDLKAMGVTKVGDNVDVTGLLSTLEYFHSTQALARRAFKKRRVVLVGIYRSLIGFL